MSEFHEITLKDVAKLAWISSQKIPKPPYRMDPTRPNETGEHSEDRLKRFLAYRTYVEDWLDSKEALYRLNAGEKIRVKVEEKLFPHGADRKVVIERSGN